ncbi:uncharacterized protein [Atheta coriaria]|uniref:uncharacterized protein n=1 Tax=Dalotia coriaria TaxID=877792 RepID=UPI0031F3661B
MRAATSILRARINIVPVSTTMPELDTDPYIQGLWPYTITEFVSQSNHNKTPLCFKIIAKLLCTTRDYHIVYFTTKGTFSEEAVVDLVKGYGKNPELVQRRVKVYDIHKLDGLISAYNAIKVYHINIHKLGLVVIDGIQVFFKDTVDDVPDYMDIPVMTKFFQSIKVLAVIAKFPVLCTNDLAVEVKGGNIYLTPYLDERYCQFIDLRVSLDKIIGEDGEEKWVPNMVTPRTK